MTAPFAARSRRRRADAPLAALARIAQSILDGHDADEVLITIAQEALEIVAATGAIIGVPTVDGTGIVVRGGASALSGNLPIGGIVRGSILPLEGGVMGRAIRESRAIVSPDASRARAAYLVEAARRTGIGPVVAVPLTIRDRIFGGLEVVRLAGSPPFSRAEYRSLRHLPPRPAWRSN